ncbi:MAG: ATP-binding protein [Bacillota bacterium]
MFRSLRSRLIISYVIVVALTLLIGAFSLLGLFVRAERVAVTQETIALTNAPQVNRFAARILEQGLLDPFTQAWLEALATTAQRFGGEFYIVDTQGRIVAKAGSAGAAAGQTIPANLVQRAITSTRSRQYLRVNQPFGEPSFLAAVQVKDSSGVIGAVVARRPAAVSWQAALTLLRQQALAGLIAAVVGLVIALVLAERIIRPVRKMTAAAEAISRGEYEHKLEVTGQDEVATLARAFDAMSAKLAGTVGRLSTEKTKLEAVLSNMAEPLLAIDRDGRIVLVNSAAEPFVGARAEDAAGQTCADALRPQELVEAVRRGMAEEGAEGSEEIGIEGGRRWLSLHLAPFTLADGTSGRVVVIHDITSLKEAEQARRDFVSNISHELRTPVTTLRGFVEAIRDGVVGGVMERERYLGIMDEEIGRLSRLIEDLFQFSKLEAGKMDYRFEGLDPARLVDRVAEKVRPRLEREGLELRVEQPAGDYPLVVADSDRIEQVFFNLISNAVRFTPDGGRVTISAVTDEDRKRVIFSVADTGAGIPAADLPRIFERFYKAKTAAGRRAGGTGLGLAIVKHIVLDHGGAVWVESEEGKGSKFSFALRQMNGEGQAVQ